MFVNTIQHAKVLAVMRSDKGFLEIMLRKLKSQAITSWCLDQRTHYHQQKCDNLTLHLSPLSELHLRHISLYRKLLVSWNKNVHKFPERLRSSLSWISNIIENRKMQPNNLFIFSASWFYFQSIRRIYLKSMSFTTS